MHLFTHFISEIPEIIGIAGVIMTLIAYFLLQINALSQDGVSFSLLNSVGSFFILISLYFHWNTSATLMEGAWLIISLYGVIKSVRLRLKKNNI